MILDVFVPGLAKAQGRPRARGFIAGGRVAISMYDPQTSRDWKQVVAWNVAKANGGRHPMDGPLFLSLDFILPRPKSLPKRVILHTKKPDLDNLAKAVKDALKGIAYRDDSQVVRMIVSKGYDTGHSPPGVRIQLSTIGED